MVLAWFPCRPCRGTAPLLPFRLQSRLWPQGAPHGQSRDCKRTGTLSGYGNKTEDRIGDFISKLRAKWLEDLGGDALERADGGVKASEVFGRRSGVVRREEAFARFAGRSGGRANGLEGGIFMYFYSTNSFPGETISGLFKLQICLFFEKFYIKVRPKGFEPPKTRFYGPRMLGLMRMRSARATLYPPCRRFIPP